MQWNQNLCLPSKSMAGSTSGSGNLWTAGILQGTTSPKRPTPDLKSSTSGIRIRSKRWTWISSPESVMCWTAPLRTLSNTHLADALWLLRCGVFYLKILIFIFYLLLLIIKSSHKNCHLENKYLLENDTCHHNYYINKKIEPTEENDGKIFFICGFCGNQYIESIPKLNGKII